MPKVSEEHKSAQRQRFLDAARRCVSRLGIEATSMEDIRVEAGLSAGAMYRYFPTRDSVIRSAISTSMDEVEILIDQAAQHDSADSAPGYLRHLLGELRRYRYRIEEVDLFRVAIQGWALAQSDPESAAILQASLERQIRSHTRAARRWTTARKSAAAASAIGAAVAGYVVECALGRADIDPAGFCDGMAIFSR